MELARKLLLPIYTPIGFDLGGPTPDEIAVSILVEVIAVRRGGKAAPVLDKDHSYPTTGQTHLN